MDGNNKITAMYHEYLYTPHRQHVRDGRSSVGETIMTLLVYTIQTRYKNEHKQQKRDYKQQQSAHTTTSATPPATLAHHSRSRASAEEILPDVEAEGSLDAAAPHPHSRPIAVLKVHVHPGPTEGGHVAFHQRSYAAVTATTAATVVIARSRGVIVGFAVVSCLDGYTLSPDLEEEAFSCPVVLFIFFDGIRAEERRGAERAAAAAAATARNCCTEQERKSQQQHTCITCVAERYHACTCVFGGWVGG